MGIGTTLKSGQYCKYLLFAEPGNYLVRYGNTEEGKFFYYGVFGKDKVYIEDCSDSGDVSGFPDTNEFTIDASYTDFPSEISPDPDDWELVATENERFTLEEPTWVTLTNDDFSMGIRKLMHGLVRCKTYDFNVQNYLNEGLTKCYKYKESVETTETWSTCASSGSNCDLPNFQQGDKYLVRYGAEIDGYNGFYVVVLAETPSIRCDYGYFGKVNPIDGQPEHCEYMNIGLLSQSVMQFNAEWNLLATCRGDCSIEQEISVGSEYSEEYGSAEEYSREVMMGITAHSTVGKEGVGESGISVTTEVTNSFTQSSSFTQALSHSMETSTEFSCEGDGMMKHLYQFRLSSSRMSFEKGFLKGATDTYNLLCLNDPPQDYNGPRCYPNDCANEYCTACLSTEKDWVYCMQRKQTSPEELVCIENDLAMAIHRYGEEGNYLYWAGGFTTFSTIDQNGKKWLGNSESTSMTELSYSRLYEFYLQDSVAHILYNQEKVLDQPAWVYYFYPDPDTTNFRVIGRVLDGTVICKASTFGYLSDENDYVENLCFVFSIFQEGETPNWTVCTLDTHSCDIKSWSLGLNYLVRYGNQNSYVYQYGSMSNFECSNDFFGQPDSTQFGDDDIFCSYMQIPEYFH
ncbi:hypothetical protein M0813_21781 [Anaeramoeba flamelloides]|uniref:CEL-III C-terminal domain-containing protein n=1 Tax=Anaeramoeba flamelloides TaxID=1746091 RepID=A0ABQ8YFP6_9EUKA|nr:hypothetical protein M0813_21781 [Anaeramoeba flamelloides]